uniref:Uncharacterized protein n=1 Tax=Inonotus obliquus TaxID=167356 RepID=A0A5A4UC13_9AGAM|nr:hypothetical protein [Inonotus obliquus]BBN21300.1 hypothetical protein [Inonotus obliquus]
MEINHQLTWVLALVLIFGCFYFFKDVMFDLTNKIYSIIRNLFKKFINYLNDIKHNVDNTNFDKFNNQIKDHIKENKNLFIHKLKRLLVHYLRVVNLMIYSLKLNLVISHIKLYWLLLV